MSAANWRVLVGEYKAIVQAVLGRPLPLDVNEQLCGAIAAVFDSWDAERELIGPLLPSERGGWARTARGNRRLLNGMLHALRVG